MQKSTHPWGSSELPVTEGVQTASSQLLVGDVIEGISALFPRGAKTDKVGREARTQWAVNKDVTQQFSDCASTWGQVGKAPNSWPTQGVWRRGSCLCPFSRMRIMVFCAVTLSGSEGQGLGFLYLPLPLPCSVTWKVPAFLWASVSASNKTTPPKAVGSGILRPILLSPVCCPAIHPVPATSC